MKRVSLAAIVMMWACGGKTAPPPAPTGNKPVADTVVASDPKAPEGPSCQLAARMLMKERGPGKIPAKHWDRARTAGEAEIVALCLTDQWDDETLACFPKRASAFSCLSNLSSDLQYKYERRVDDWEYFTMMKLDQGELGGVGYGGAGYGGAGYGGMYGGMGTSGQPEEEWIACETTMGDVTLYAPAIPEKVPERDFLVSQRKQYIARTCNMQWKNPDKKCFGAAKDAASIEACRSKLTPTAKNALTNMIADSTGKHKKLVALKKKPKQIDCKNVALSFYSDDSVRGKLTGIDGAERERVLKESRDKMSAVCTSEKWDATRRACTVLANGQMYDLADCYPLDQPSGMYKWMFPVGGIFFKTGIMACDAATETVKKILTCTQIEQAMRDSVADRYTQELSSYVEYGGMGDDATKRCQELNDSYKAGAKEFGCPGF